MAVLLSPVGGVAGQFFDNNGNPLTGGKMYSYVAGTTTPQATYTSSAGTVAHSNPIILDAGGRVPGGEIWLTDGLQYKFVLKNANDVLIGTYDNIIGINSNFVNFLTETEVQTATAGQTVFTLTTMQYQPGTNNLTVYVDGVNQIDGSTYSYVETSSTVVTFTAGLHVGALVKFTTAQTLSTGVTDASLVTYQPPFIGGVDTTVENKLAQTVSVKDFGAVGDGVTDDTVAIQNAISSATANKNTLVFPAGTYALPSLTSALQFDLGVMSAVTSGNVTLDFSGTSAPGQYAIWLYSSLGYPTSHYQNTTHKFEGFVCKGAGDGGINGLLVYHPTYTSNCQFQINSSSFTEFNVNLYLEANAWRVSFNNCVFLNANTQNVTIGNGVNQGESVKFDHCLIGDGGDFTVSGSGTTLNLYSTSILNTPVLITGSSNIFNVYGGNLENPGSALAYQYINVAGFNNRVTLFGTPITINPTTWTDTLFAVSSGNTLSFVDVTWPDINNYNVAATVGYSEFVSGTGRVLATSSSHWPAGGGVKPTISHLNNSLYNGDFETGTTAGWTVTPYGTGGSTAVASATAKKFGTYGLLATSVAGGGINITQRQSCMPGQLVTVFAWIQLATATSGSPWNFVQTVFTSADGTTLATYGDGAISIGTWDQFGTSASKYAPVGTANVTLTLNVQPGGNVVYFDNIVMNIV